MDKRLVKLSVGLALLFVIIGLLVYPIWSDLHAYFGGNIPVLQFLILSGGAFVGYGYYLLVSNALTEKYRKAHLIVIGLVDLVMLGILFLLFWDLGFASILIFRSFSQNLHIVFWVAVVILTIWFWPRWRPLAKHTKIISLIVLALSALVWISFPWQVDFTALPVILMQQDGVTAAWGTNMFATHEIQYGNTPEMAEHSRPHQHGLRPLNDGIATSYLPGQNTGQDLYLQVSVNGLRHLRRSSSVKGGNAETPVMRFSFPPVDDDLFLVSFSDTHEINIAYHLLARHVAWEQVDYALFLGDFVIDMGEPKDLVKNLLNLPTGDRNIPRVFARGNHETRGTGAWQLSDIFLPPGGDWYYTFSHGETLFIVLDSGEDKPDSHIEYAGVIDFTSYHLEQAEWLAKVFESDEYQNANYRLVLVHAPPFKTNYLSPAFMPVVDLLKEQTEIDLIMSGHTHQGGIWMPDETSWPYPITTNGGPLLIDTKSVTAHLTKAGIQLEVFNITGKIVETEWIPAK